MLFNCSIEKGKFFKCFICFMAAACMSLLLASCGHKSGSSDGKLVNRSIKTSEESTGEVSTDDTSDNEMNTDKANSGMIGSNNAGSNNIGSSEGNFSAASSSETSSNEAGSSEAGSNEAGSNEAGSSKAGSNGAGSSESNGSEAGSSEADSSKSNGSEAGSTVADSSESNGSETGGTETGSSGIDSSEAGSSEADSTEAGSGKADGSKAGSNGTDGSKASSNGTDGSKSGSNGTDGSKASSNGTDGSKAGSNGTDGSKASSNGTDGSKSGSNGTDGSKSGSNGTDGSKAGSNGTDGSKAGSSGTDGSKAGSSGTDGSKAGSNGTDSSKAGNNEVVSGETVPSGNQKGTVVAVANFYLSYISSASYSKKSLSSCQYVGSGKISSSSQQKGKDNSSGIADRLVEIPDVSQYVNTNEKVVWKQIFESGNQQYVVGEIYYDSTVVNKALEAQIAGYIQEAKAIENAYSPAVTYYFAMDGNDKNSGLSPDSPKYNPTDCIRKGNCNVLLKSGDIFTINWSVAVGSNVKISTYGGSKRAVINWVPANDNTFSVYDRNNGIYYAALSAPTDRHLNMAYLVYADSSTDWQRVFAYADLVADGDFYCDVDASVLYIKSNRDLSGVPFAYGSASGGISFKDGANGLIENIEIVGGGIGINVDKYSNFICRNCYVHHCGGLSKIGQQGNIVRYGNGIQLWNDNIHNAYVYNNVVTDIFDAGITPQISGTDTSPSDNINIFNNLVRRCLYSIEYYQSGTTAETYDIVIQNNVLSDTSDITKGHRNATYGFNSYFCMWRSVSDKSQVLIANNFGFTTDSYAFAYYADTPKGVNNYNSNTLVVVGKDSLETAIKNSKYYDGPKEDIIMTTYGSPEYKKYEREFLRRLAAFDQTSLYFKYMEEKLLTIQ